ncbi:hypothetical protein [Roseovarius dicentrarchi]|uniref:hypothetical protein n=1 Tax=Roseovarius dicentrarchi TaxID=2250573 RepID=UPI00139673EB|nr:hypothetical protein [Roseovarius dicentrarchi]
MNSLSAAALTFALILTGQAMAQLRLTPGPSGVMEICTGHGPVRVLIGADGTPQEAAAVCPDCVMTALYDLAPPQPMAAYDPRVSRLAMQSVTAHAAGLDVVHPSARSPPGAG